MQIPFLRLCLLVSACVFLAGGACAHPGRAHEPGQREIDPALGPGERCPLEAQFPAILASVKTVCIYFPHTAPISGVPVTR